MSLCKCRDGVAASAMVGVFAVAFEDGFLLHRLPKCPWRHCTQDPS